MEQALALVRGMSDTGQAINRLREYLQAFVLRSFHESEAFGPLAFLGGTALRFLHGLPRYSEDLDFSLVSQQGYNPLSWMAKLKRDLLLSGFTPEMTWNDRKTVHVGWINVSGLLRTAGFSHRADQKLSIKVEIDTRPPRGARLERSVITRHLTFLVQHHDLPSLLAGKLHALICRQYVKGRDWYDLVWHLSLRPPNRPNEELLQAALDQTQGAGRHDARGWGTLVRNRLASLAMPAILKDVAPFLERPQDAALLTRENIEGLLSRIREATPKPQAD